MIREPFQNESRIIRPRVRAGARGSGSREGSREQGAGIQVALATHLQTAPGLFADACLASLRGVPC